MHVLLAAEWTDPGGVPYRAGESVDVDAVTLAELEVLGVVEDLNTQETSSGDERRKTETGRVIGPGPGVPAPAPGGDGGDGPTVPKPDDGD